jgi:hypothetical protein
MNDFEEKGIRFSITLPREHYDWLTAQCGERGRGRWLRDTIDEHRRNLASISSIVNRLDRLDRSASIMDELLKYLMAKEAEKAGINVDKNTLQVLTNEQEVSNGQ